jgi:hypothetical protein
MVAVMTVSNGVCIPVVALKGPEQVLCIIFRGRSAYFEGLLLYVPCFFMSSAFVTPPTILMEQDLGLYSLFPCFKKLDNRGSLMQPLSKKIYY